MIRDAIYDLVARNRYRWFGRRPASPTRPARSQPILLGFSRLRDRKSIYCSHHRPSLAAIGDREFCAPAKKGGRMSNIQKFNLREWLVPPILLPIFLGLLIAGAVIIRW
jgi:hypothetical protein